MKKCKLDLLILLVKKGALYEDVPVCTGKLSAELGGSAKGASQQTVSRWLLELQATGRIQKNGRHVRITPFGKVKIEEVFYMVKGALEKKNDASTKEFEITGKVTTGFREGRYYLAIPEYKKQISSALGFSPFAGTLNLRLSKQKDIENIRKLKAAQGIATGEFSRDDRSFGSAKCFHILIAGKIKGALIFPARSHYGDGVVEVIAPINLREKLKLKDGKEVSLKIFPQNSTGN
ncbi:MAG: DUF120 domain-containing protein [Candidatus Micrarchaeia archaeon]|jgi:riboflavin kinase